MSMLAANITGLDLNRLAEELGAGLKPPIDVWHSFGIMTRKDAAAILGLESFQEMLHEAHIRWHTKSNLRERIKAKTLVGMEQFLPDMFDDAMDPARPLHHRVQMWKFLGALAGLDAEAGAAGSASLGGGVQITIDLSGSTDGGDDPKVVVIRGNGADPYTGVAADEEGPLQVEGSVVDDAEEHDEDEQPMRPRTGMSRGEPQGSTDPDEDDPWSVELAELDEVLRGIEAG